MPANKNNYIILYLNESQIYGTASREIALSTPPPAGSELKDKRVFFITYQPDNEILSVHPVSQEEVLNAELKEKKKSDVQA